MGNNVDEIYEKLKQLPKIENATFSDTFNQRVKLYNDEQYGTAIVLGVELALLWQTFDKFIKQTHEIVETLLNQKDEQ